MIVERSRTFQDFPIQPEKQPGKFRKVAAAAYRRAARGNALFFPSPPPPSLPCPLSASSDAESPSPARGSRNNARASWSRVCGVACRFVFAASAACALCPYICANSRFCLSPRSDLYTRY